MRNEMHGMRNEGQGERNSAKTCTLMKRMRGRKQEAILHFSRRASLIAGATTGQWFPSMMQWGCL